MHAGSKPNAAEQQRLSEKVGYLVQAGIPEQEAVMILYSMGQFTIGCVLEQQARTGKVVVKPGKRSPAAMVSGTALHPGGKLKIKGSDRAFEFGISLLLEGMQRRMER